jgi:hypothetical protein
LKGEGARYLGACAGLALWFAYPFVEWHGGQAAHLSHGRLEPFIDSVDPCFDDHLPMGEMAAFPITLILAYFFARFAFSLYAPSPEARSWRWWFATRSAPEDLFPAFQVLIAIGILWAVVYGSKYWPALYPYLLYWGAWLGWFLLGAWLSRPRRRP